MANNFRITGTRYVSKGGHDSNDGITPDNPKKSIPTSGNANLVVTVVGTGVYNQHLLLTGTFNQFCEYVADGRVDVNGDFGAGQNQSNAEYDGFSLTGNMPSTTNMQNRFRNCHLNLLGGTFYCGNLNSTNFLVDSIIRNVSSGDIAGDVLRNIFIDVTVVANTGTIILNNYFDINCNILYPTTPPSSPTRIRFCNINGLIILLGFKYAIQDQFTGTPQDNGYAADVYWLNEANLTANGYTGTIAGWDAAVATCINRDPKFNNASKLDFTLQADSPHIGRASDGFSNIGGTEYAQSFYAGISNPNILLFEASEAVDTTTNNNDWRLKPGYNEGWIRAIIKVSNNDVQISSIPYIGNYSFDSDQLGGSSTNMNVPDSKPITNEYPDYLTVTTQAANDTTLIIAGHGAVVGDWLWVDGQYREITGVPDADTVTFATSLRAIVVVGTVVKIGTFESLASLNPNRLNMKMRSSKLVDVNASNWDNPLTWDNDGLSPSGQYMAQEWNNAPMIDSLNEVGFGDDNYDANYGNPINLKVVDIMIYLRNNYRS